MHRFESLLKTHPDGPDAVPEAVRNALMDCASCAAVCRACADACLAETGVAELRECIRRNLDCAAICSAMTEIGSRSFTADRDYFSELLVLCARACAECASECEKHDTRHCEICAQACRDAERACRAAQVGMRG